MHLNSSTATEPISISVHQRSVDFRSIAAIVVSSPVTVGAHQHQKLHRFDDCLSLVTHNIPVATSTELVQHPFYKLGALATRSRNNADASVAVLMPPYLEQQCIQAISDGDDINTALPTFAHCKLIYAAAWLGLKDLCDLLVQCTDLDIADCTHARTNRVSLNWRGLMLYRSNSLSLLSLMHAQGKLPRTAIRDAVRYGAEAVDELICHLHHALGYRVDATEEGEHPGKTALRFAMKHHRPLSVIRALIDNGANCHLKDSHGRTPYDNYNVRGDNIMKLTLLSKSRL